MDLQKCNLNRNSKNQPVSGWFSIAFDALKNNTFAYEFTVREQLSHIILSIYSELKDQLNNEYIQPELNSVRVEKILSFMEQHYPENIKEYRQIHQKKPASI